MLRFDNVIMELRWHPLTKCYSITIVSHVQMIMEFALAPADQILFGN